MQIDIHYSSILRFTKKLSDNSISIAFVIKKKTLVKLEAKRISRVSVLDDVP